MAKPKKTPRPKAQTPKGFADYFGKDVTERAEMLRTIAGVNHRYGFDALESSADAAVEDGSGLAQRKAWTRPVSPVLSV
mgnify:CR=1 FL=1